jgi:signal transduction histidine kinase
MSVHEQLGRARHEEPLRTIVRDRRVRASQRRSPGAARRDADTDRALGWFTQALRLWVRSRHPCVPTGAQPDAFTPNGSLAGLVITQEQDRRRLCRELHDGLGPTMAGLALGLGTAQALSAGQPDLHELLGRLTAETQRAVTDLRRIVYGLRPSALDELGLAGALCDQAERFRRQAPTLAISLDAPIKGLAGLPPVVEMACYRIVTEALANVARHAHATRCAVRIHLDHGIHVDVRDNGAGLPAHWRAGVGIASMRERASELGGELVIEPSRPHGTRVAARLPVGEQP